jgi:hypothetical protein
MTAPPVPPDDEQVERLAGSGELPVVAGDDECLTSAEGMPTQVAPPIPDDDKPPTVATPYAFPEAYSEEPPERVGRSWRVAWRDAVLITVAGLAVATAAGLGAWVLLDQHQKQPPVPQPPTSSQTATPQPPPPPPPLSTTTVVVTPPPPPLPPSTVTVTTTPARPTRTQASSPELDQQYLNEVTGLWGGRPAKPDAVIRNGHRACELLAQNPDPAAATRRLLAEQTAAGAAGGLDPETEYARTNAVVVAASDVYCPQ